MSENRPSRGPGVVKPDPLSSDDLKAIIDGDGQRTVAAAERLAKQLRDVRKSQLRKFYADLLRQAGDLRRLPFLKARLAYAASRQPDLQKLEWVFTRLIDEVAGNEAAFERIKDFAEAVVAYHSVTRVGKED